MKRRNIVVANWKMNPTTIYESKEIFDSLRVSSQKLKNTDVIVCPPFTSLNYLSKLKRSKNIFIGAQNVFHEDRGAFTGEISAPMVKDAGASFVLVGHSERRNGKNGFGETNEQIKLKLQSCFNNKIEPIFCIGEKERSRDGEHLDLIRNQIKESLFGLMKKDVLGLIIAYEPIWAIGRSYRDAMSGTDIHETVLFIRKIVAELFGQDIANSIRILYGGSVEKENITQIVEHGNVDGFLVGHASLNSEDFSFILKSVDTKK